MKLMNRAEGGGPTDFLGHICDRLFALATSSGEKKLFQGRQQLLPKRQQIIK